MGTNRKMPCPLIYEKAMDGSVKGSTQNNNHNQNV